MVKNNWELIDLRVLCAVAHRASLTGAALDLGISVAYVTKRIARLEKILATPLFLRTTRRVNITAQGEVVYNWARKVLQAADELDHEVAQSRGALRGSLKVSTSQRLGSMHIAPLLAKLRQQHTELEVWLELVDRRVDMIAEGFDIDIRVGEVREPHLIAQKMAHSTRILCASPAYLVAHGRPANLADLANHNCLLFRDRDQPFAKLRMHGPHGEESVQVSGSMGSNQSDPILQWACMGHGIALLSQWDVAQSLRLGLVERVLPDYAQSADIYAVLPTRSTQSAKLQVCLDFLRRELSGGRLLLDADAA